MSGKWLELLEEVAPQVERVGFMMHPETPALIRYFKSAEALAPALKVERGLTAFAAERNGGIVVGPHAVTLTNRDLIVALAAHLRLPALYPLAFYAKAGGLISHGFDPVNQFQQGAGYVDRILRGAKPADLPVQYPTKLQLVCDWRSSRPGLQVDDGCHRAEKPLFAIGLRSGYLRCPKPIPSFKACCLRAPTVRFIAREILAARVLFLE